MTKLHDLCRRQGQSPWLDNLRRDYVRGGRLGQYVSEGIRGVTSNPTIFTKAIEGGDDYDAQLRDLLPTHSVEDAYWELVVTDISEALAVLRGVHDTSAGVDGYVSLEVAPGLAHDTAATIAAARHFHQMVDQPHLYVKIPATGEGIPAIRAMVGEGRNINITLLFSLERYDEVIEAYLGGLEDMLAAGAADLSGVHSVASFFVSRVDTEVDRRLQAIAGEVDGQRAREVMDLRGTAAVAQARLAYQLFRRKFSGPRWEALAARVATLQRPLWASTSTKYPSYPDLLYVNSLIGADTVNTMPDDTIAAFLDHGQLVRSVDADPDDARRTMERVESAGVDMADVGHTLEDEGVASFVKSFDELIQSLSDKANALSGGR